MKIAAIIPRLLQSRVHDKLALSLGLWEAEVLVLAWLLLIIQMRNTLVRFVLVLEEHVDDLWALQRRSHALVLIRLIGLLVIRAKVTV